MKYKKKTLSNGLRVIVVPAHANPAVTVLVLVETGSNYEDKSKSGLSHFLEHMMFKGTTRRPTALNISREFDSLGAQSNAFTSNEMTGYYAKAESRHFKRVLDILSDLYLNPTLPPAEVEKERGVILQEISMYEDQPQHKVWEILCRLMYGDTPAGRPTIGTVENVKKFTRDDCDDYRRRHYIAKKTLIVVAGDVTEREAIRGVEDAFATIPNHKKIGKERVSERQKSAQLKVLRKKSDQTHMVMAFRTFGANDKRRAALSVLSGVLGRGMSSRLWQRLREDMGACYYVRTSDLEFSDHGFLAISTGIDGKRIEEVAEAILDECRKCKTELVSDAEIQKAKDYIVGHLYMGLETSDALAEFYADQEVTRGKIETPADVERAIRGVTAEDVRKVAKDVLRADHLNLAVVGDIRETARLRKLLVI